MTASRIRAQLKHPVIDADGHWLEFGPNIRKELRRIGGDKAVEGFYRLYRSSPKRAGHVCGRAA